MKLELQLQTSTAGLWFASLKSRDETYIITSHYDFPIGALQEVRAYLQQNHPEYFWQPVPDSSLEFDVWIGHDHR